MSINKFGASMAAGAILGCATGLLVGTAVPGVHSLYIGAQELCKRPSDENYGRFAVNATLVGAVVGVTGGLIACCLRNIVFP